jgi:hypothetical protein
LNRKTVTLQQVKEGTAGEKARQVETQQFRKKKEVRRGKKA